MKKKITLSVADFALPQPRQGSIDLYSGFNQGTQEGQQLHKDIQALRQKNDPSYQAEVWCMHKFSSKKYIFEVSGRMDGIYYQEKWKIEEIKSAFDLNKLSQHLKDTQDTHPYWLQLKTYGYMYWLKYNIVPDLNLHLVSSRHKNSMDLPLELDIKQYETWLEQRLKELSREVKQAENRIKQRKKSALAFTFPFPNARSGQKELIAEVEVGMQQHQPMLIQAPTGLGKTMGILYPTLQESLQRGQKSIYLTPKNSQHIAALDAVEKLQAVGSEIKVMTITAKKKLCFKAEQLCNSEYCEFAENHYSKIEDHKLLSKIQKETNLTATNFKTMGEKYQVCPYELQMETIPFMDVVICDYNYVFSQSATNNRVGKIPLGESEKPNLIIDEIHNLPHRAMEYYSPALSSGTLEKMYFIANKNINEWQEKILGLLASCMTIITDCGHMASNRPHIITPSLTIFKNQELKIQEFLAEYLQSNIQIEPGDIVLELYNYWMEFTLALELVNNGREEFFVSYLPTPATVKITCCDAASMLTDCYSNFAEVVGFSATLKPFNYYSQLSGLHSSKLKTAEFSSPFPLSNRKVIIIPQISSKYSERPRSYPRIVEVINKITALKPGNYFIFFPSFEFLERVLEQYPPCADFTILQQTPRMNHQQVTELLAQLHHPNVHHLIFAVQGGIFAEGVDYPGNLAIGAFIIGPPLPMFDWEREQMKKYYEKHYLAGFDYAYTFPAMAKAVQAAGRVIRSEADKGLIVLIDNRFLHESYAKCMPSDWFTTHPTELVSQAILKEITAFWQLSS